MKKFTLLLLTACNLLMFSQNTRNSDVQNTTQKPPVVYNTPTKPYVTLAAYNAAFNSQNINAPLLYGQFPPIGTSTITSQQFEAANAQYNSNAADDFTVPAGKSWQVSAIYVRGYSISPVYPTSYKVTFYTNTGSNLPGTIIRTENVILAAGSNSPTLPLATALSLAAGKYWVSVQAVLDFAGGGQWYWETYSDSSTLSSPYAWTNPGNGFGTPCNTVWNTGSICIPGQLKDLAFSLDGIESNSTAATCKTYVARIVSTDPTETTRLYRDAVPSVCGTAKVYPTPAFAGNYHYRSYTIQNTLPTTNCVTVNLTNTDAVNQVHLVAYSGTFNPANIALNYMGDSGTSSVGGSVATMSITMPANSTMVIVANEATANSTFTGDYTLDVLSTNCGGILRTGETGGKSVNVYPNPVKTVLFVNGMKVNDAKVYDASGKLVPVKTSENQINVEGLTKGNYLLQMNDKDGNTTTTKFIKK
ncbi:T9SS type A sorting domain-containing protein [Kaistella sp. G5-32]|uniref:T9SS type A sorting domain-containing protein n=1 Tax=Kaistella gelatinilytica TaxID=2787636 RepID=A0ABS0FEZ3_9FLAO|nr:T9SS type A sorting domain-containing protein [Kaistella gelatinilytica]MBF8458278.1 T9SS type A sorting domain-containing protein [Kaistella gelatinilytica]